MINLLPPDYKSNMLYARRNTALRRWISLMLIALLITVLIIGSGLFLMDRSVRKQSREVETASKNLKEQKIDETKAKLDEISADTKLILEVLSREVLFSSLLRQLGAVLPANTELETIQIDKVEGGISLNASAADVDAAAQIQVNLSDPNNKIFSSADIESINCTPAEGDTQQKYPCSARIRALFSKNNPYVYISRNNR